MTKIQASHILVQHEFEAVDLQKKLAEGKVFEELAIKFSQCPSAKQGGLLGVFGRGRMVEEFEEAVFALEVGEISKPVRTKFGYHIIKRLA